MYSAGTDGKRLWGRRQFLHTAAGGAAAAVVAGAPFMTGCGPSNEATPDPTSSEVIVQSTDVATTPTDEVIDPTTSNTPVISSAGSVAYRLSTRSQRAPCNACKAHAAHRYFATAEAADASRAHAGCRCTVVANPVTSQQFETWFDATAKDTFDDRWGG